jgi:hypothetical protein
MYSRKQQIDEGDIFTHAYMYIHTCTYIQIKTHTYIGRPRAQGKTARGRQINTCIHIHTYIHTYIHMHTHIGMTKSAGNRAWEKWPPLNWRPLHMILFWKREIYYMYPGGKLYCVMCTLGVSYTVLCVLWG